jgi:hypothetical protein
LVPAMRAAAAMRMACTSSEIANDARGRGRHRCGASWLPRSKRGALAVCGSIGQPHDAFLSSASSMTAASHGSSPATRAWPCLPRLLAGWLVAIKFTPDGRPVICLAVGIRYAACRKPSGPGRLFRRVRAW